MKNILLILIVSLIFYNEAEAAIIRVPANFSLSELIIVNILIIVVPIIIKAISEMKHEASISEFNERYKKFYDWFYPQNFDDFKEMWLSDIPMSGRIESNVEKSTTLFWKDVKIISSYDNSGNLGLIRIVFYNWIEGKHEITSKFESQLHWRKKNSNVWHSPKNNKHKTYARIETEEDNPNNDLFKKYWEKSLIINMALHN